VKTLSISTKFAYGVGQVAEGIKSRGFDIIVFFYFTQVLGLQGSLAGAAVAIALIFDAVTDPVVGQLSDNWKSRLGRRHPFMYASALPMAVAWLLLFFPPTGLGQTGLFFWLLSFAVLVRAALTLYHVPHMALGAELSDDYVERTSVVQWRTLSGMVGSLGVIGLGIYYFFPASDSYSNGLLNPAHYPAFAVFSSILIFLTIWYSAWGTRKQIPRLPAPPAHPASFSISATYQGFSVAWNNPSFRSLFVGFSLFAIALSLFTTLGTHMNVYYWGFSNKEISIVLMPLALGFLVGVAISGLLHVRLDKRPSVIGSALIAGALGNAAVIARMMGLMPNNGDPLLFGIILALQLGFGLAAGVAFASAGSMMADVSSDHYQRTGLNQQGLLFAAFSFSSKLGSAAGHLLAGVGIDLIQFPLKSDPGLITHDMVTRLGILSLLALPLSLLATYAYTRYQITRESFEASMRKTDSE
jgi:Na+/melibiose symporter-like transporter